jgi:hypothetical protein
LQAPFDGIENFHWRNIHYSTPSLQRSAPVPGRSEVERTRPPRIIKTLKRMPVAAPEDGRAPSANYVECFRFHSMQ